MEKPQLLQEHIKIGTVYYYFNNVFQTASAPRKICKIEGGRFYYGTNTSAYNVINDLSLYLIRLPIKRYMGYIECSETTSLLHNELRAYLMMKQGGLNGSDFDFKGSYAHYFIDENNQVSRELINLEGSSYYNDTTNFLDWASRNKIKSNKTTYKVGDYIVCLDNPNPNPGRHRLSTGGHGFVKNTCLKIVRITNIDEYQVLFCEHHINGIYDNSVRPATTNEIAKYNLIGNRYDIIKDSLVGRHVKALQNSICSSGTKKGLIYKIIEEDDKEIILNIEKAKYFSKNSLKHLELMPKKFTLNEDQPKEEFKQGDWIIRTSNEYNLPSQNHPNITTGKMYKAGSVISNKNIVYVIDDHEILCQFDLHNFRKATKKEIDSFIGNIPKPGEWVYFYEFNNGCSGVGEVNQAYLVTDSPSKRGLINENYTNFNVLDESGVSWEVNGRYERASPEEVDFAIRKASLHRMNVVEEFMGVPLNWYLKVTEENVEFINSERDRSMYPGTYLTSKLIDPLIKNSWYAKNFKIDILGEEITLHQFKKYVLRDIETKNSYNNYGAAVKQPEETNSSLTNSNSEKVIKLIKPQPQKMSIDSVLSMDINLRTNKKTTQIKI